MVSLIGVLDSDGGKYICGFIVAFNISVIRTEVCLISHGNVGLQQV